MTVVRDAQGEIGGLPAFWREADPAGPSPILYVHGNPSNSDIWVPFLERTGGLAPDLPGWGRSGKPASFDYTVEGLSGWLEAFLDHHSVGRFTLAVHDWGGLALAMRPEVLARLDGLLSLGHVPVGVAGFRWHRIARRWRTPVVGELAMGFTTRWVLRQLLREGRDQKPMPDWFLDSVWDHFDQGTQRAILKLYRSAPEDRLASATDLSAITCPALLLWSRRDPYLMPAVTGPATAAALGGPTEFELLDVLGHWWWVDDAALIERPVEFLLGPSD
jgi:pimeloyl-ACP methyl ester carboxylesterase